MSLRMFKFNEKLHCKLECELDYGSYKVRGVKNYFKKKISPSNFQVLSAGNLASACVGEAKKHDVICTAVVPEEISRIKEEKIKNLGGELKKVPFSELWSMVENESLIYSEEILHPIHPDLIEGYGHIVDDILDEYKDFDNIFLPYGLGGLALGVVRTKKRLNLNFNIYLVEIEGYSPFKSSLDSNENVMNEHLTSFIEAMGAPGVLEFVFNELKSEIKDVVTVRESDVKNTIRDFYRTNRIKVEGAAGAALAGALKLNLRSSVVLLTGQNISSDVFEGIINDHDN